MPRRECWRPLGGGFRQPPGPVSSPASPLLETLIKYCICNTDYSMYRLFHLSPLLYSIV
ncbi:hypothetical protein I79_021136 [Cricetulus griseus]|uniref:Uncharacterized protein n=1 Tax=Cricetulus griseus TaxID=10029 RepID=G3IBV3_CRIGR|nr:hypothetical protein I79_021136 [Cricetulus griseus]